MKKILFITLFFNTAIFGMQELSKKSLHPAIPRSLASDTLRDYEYTEADFNKWYEEHKLEGMSKLEECQREAIKPSFYVHNIEQGHNALQSFSHHVLELVKNHDSIPLDEAVKEKFTHYMIELRDGSLGLREIEVRNEMTAIVYAVSCLTNQEKGYLQRDSYPLNKEKALNALTKMAGLSYDQLHVKNLHNNRSKEEYTESFVAKKIKELEELSRQ